VTSEESTADPLIYRISPQGAATVFRQGPELDRPVGLSITPDERTLLLSTEDGDVVLSIDIATKAITQRAIANEPLAAIPTPDGSILATEKVGARILRVPAGVTTGTVFSDDPVIAWPGDLVLEPARCAGLVPTVVGTTGADVLNGSAFADVIDTLGGNDVVNGLGGNDVICGGAGRDGLRGGPGRDTLYGQAGPDKLVGGNGRDKLVGGKGKDKLIGGKGKDKLKGGKGKDKEKQ
jgi:Ca2+-binding RTX toxin-like protein